MPIVYYEGVEGAGKTAFMTRELLYHHKCGGLVFALPGYELKNSRGRIISELLLPEKWVMLLKEQIYDYAVAVDEVQNFINKHNWYEHIVDMLTYGAAAQRRKRRFAMLVTGPIFDWLPRDMKDMFHEVVHCKDRHWAVKTIPRGEQTIFQREDKRGMLSGHAGRMTKPAIFKGKKYWKYYDTYSIVDPTSRFATFKFKKTTSLIDPETGREIESRTLTHTDITGGSFDTQWGWMVEKIKHLQEHNIRYIKPDQLKMELGVNFTKKIRDILSMLGVTWDNNEQAYRIR